MSPDAYPVNALKLWVVLNRAARSIEGALREQTERHGLSLTEFAVLEVLLHKGALPLGELGVHILRVGGSTTYLADKLERRGLMVRRPCTEDRRLVYAELTDKGRALIEEVFAEHAGHLAGLMGGLTPDEQATAADLLKRLGLYAQTYPALPPLEKEAPEAPPVS